MAKYDVTLRISGQEKFRVKADTEVGAVELAARKYEEMYSSGSYHIGSDFDWDTVKVDPVPVQEDRGTQFLEASIRLHDSYVSCGGKDGYELPVQVLAACTDFAHKYNLTEEVACQIARGEIPVIALCRLYTGNL